jgi:hypothetical protein
MDTINPNQMPPITNEPDKKSSVASLVAVIIILALIIVGGLYFLKQRSSQPIYTPPATTNSDSVTASLNTQGSSDSLDSIEKDLNSTDLNNLDQGAAAIDAELQ